MSFQLERQLRNARACRPRLALIYRDRGDRADGIRDHTAMLSEALTRLGADVSAPRVSRPWSWDRASIGSRDAVVIQYQPFAWGRWGLAPGLLSRLAYVRSKRRRPLIVLFVHEPAVPLTGFAQTCLGTIQRLQLWALRAQADVICTPVEVWAHALHRLRPARPCIHVPVSSNIPDRRAERIRRRAELGLSDGTIAIATLGTAHPSRLLGHIAHALHAVAASGLEAVWLDLGADPASYLTDPLLPVRRPGFLEADELASWLAASDLFLAPWRDGATARRGSLMAALSNAVPVVSTLGPLTDSVLSDATDALLLIPREDAEAFSRAVFDLCLNHERRRRIGLAGRELYEREFAWAVSARTLLAACGPGVQPANRTG